MTVTEKPLAILLMGPTASGKTALSLSLARALKTEIISVDSALVYRGMDIGTAKPDLAERNLIPHHLIDLIDPTQTFSTGQFRDQAYPVMAAISGQGKIPILAGGTMLYFSALTQGLAQLPPANPEIRQRLDQQLEQHGKQAMHDRLAQVDPQAAARIHVNDPQRVQRALEVYEITGRPLTSFFERDQQHDMPYDYIRLIVAPQERQTLHQRIATRFGQMLEQGLLDEVAGLKQRGDLDLAMPSMRCVGYRQAWHYLEGEIDFDQMVAQSVAASRQLAKRQLTWLRKEQQAVWLDSETDLLAQALEIINSRQNKN